LHGNIGQKLGTHYTVGRWIRLSCYYNRV